MISLLLVAQLLLGTSNCQILYPTPSQTWLIGEVQTIRWFTGYENFTVALWQKVGEKGRKAADSTFFRKAPSV